MAKAVLGHVSGPNERMAVELYRLRQRVCDLEARVARLQEERAARAGSGTDDPGHPRSAASRAARGWPVVVDRDYGAPHGDDDRAGQVHGWRRRGARAGGRAARDGPGSRRAVPQLLGRVPDPRASQLDIVAW